MKLKLQSWIKETVDRLSGGRVWLEHGANLQDVARFIRTIRPRATTTPLIRIGGDGDGGYLLPDDLEDLKVCISPGIDTQISFDKAMAERGLHVFMVDASVDGPPEYNERFHLKKNFSMCLRMTISTICRHRSCRNATC